MLNRGRTIFDLFIAADLSLSVSMILTDTALTKVFWSARYLVLLEFVNLKNKDRLNNIVKKLSESEIQYFVLRQISAKLLP